MAEPITHLEKTIAGEVTPVTHLEHVIAEYGGGNVYESLEAGTNILIEETADGKAKISASGEISSEDTVARAEIAAIKDGTNIDSFGDVETALGDKQNTISDLSTIRSGAALGATAVQPETGKGLSTNDFTTAEKTKLDDLANIKSVGTGLSLDGTTGELTATGGGGGTSDYSDLTNKPQINSVTLTGNKSLSDLGITYESKTAASGGTALSLVTTGEKYTWDSKQSAIDSSHKLSADLVDDTSTTNKFATAAELEQIQTNKNNILNKIGASDYATQNTGGTVRVWTTTSGGETTLHIANEAPTP